QCPTACALACYQSIASAGDCACFAGAGEAAWLLIMGMIVLGIFAFFGFLYSILVATMVGQRIWQRHYHILAKKMLTK
ncbi:hypothetical protein MKW94_008290, partial [Papaver nudicaule]|nr:hypothetical protein [Papaver nudicaule]